MQARPERESQGDDLHGRQQARGRADATAASTRWTSPSRTRARSSTPSDQPEHRYTTPIPIREPGPPDAEANKVTGDNGTLQASQGLLLPRGPRPGRADGLRPAAGAALRPGHQVPGQPGDGARRLDDPHPADRRAGDARLDRLPRPHLRRPGARRTTTRLGRRQGHPMAAAGRPGDRGQQRRCDRGRRDRGRRQRPPAIRGRRRARPRSASARVAARPRPALA